MDRKRLIERIKNLLAKTVENGCTEAEAMAALEMASKMMDAHNIEDADINFGGEEVEEGGFSYKKSNGVPKMIALAIAGFTGCKVWYDPGYPGKDGEIIFFGLESDVVLAKWLLGTLSDYVSRGLKDHMKGRDFPASRYRTAAKNGFVMGCCSRINARLRELAEASRDASPVVGGRALVVVKGALVEDAYAKLGLQLSPTRARRKTVEGDSYAAGRAAGDRASFSRPVAGGAGVRMIGAA